VFDVRRSVFDVRRSVFDVRRSVFDVRSPKFDVPCSKCGVRFSVFDVRRSDMLAVLLAMALSRSVAAAPPQIGYAYPAGGQRGTTFKVEIGGQSLRDVDGARISGAGLRMSVVEYAPPLNNEERGRTDRFLRGLVRRRWSASVMQRVAGETDKPALPDHPWLRDIYGRNANELDRLRTRLFDPRRQPNAQIREQVVIEVSIAPNAQIGDRELRLASTEGLSNPLRFQVGVLPEVPERDFGGGPAAPALQPPVLLNGQVSPGETDRVRLRARRGQKLVARLQARKLVPYLADAVPGWFQATMALYDPDGNEVAWSDDYRFDPDPVLLYEVPADGVYRLDVRDAIYRGRDDFVYRIAVGELPFVTSLFPLGGRCGDATTARVRGWNLPTETLQLDTRPGPDVMRHTTVGADRGACSEVRYAVGTLDETPETEPNESRASAQQVLFPLTVNGRIGRAGDIDTFRFHGRAGQEIVAEVHARRLNSPLDSVLRLTDSKGAELALNDDHKDRELGLLTHQADSYLRVKLPHDGEYLVFLSDAQHRGGNAHAYRLHIRSPQPDFALRLVPSCVNIAPGGATRVTVHAMRKDGFDGDISLALADGPDGLVLGNARIPAGTNSATAVLSASRGLPRQITPVKMEGRAEIGGMMVSRPVVAAEDMMQAFLWRFLVPRKELLVAIQGSRPVPAVWRPLAPGFRVAGNAPVRIPLGGTASVKVEAPAVLPGGGQTPLTSVRFRLCNLPRGVTYRGAAVGDREVTLTLKADPNTALAGDAAHVIVEAFAETAEKGGDPATNGRKRIDFGVLPAIAYEVVRP